MKSTKSLILLGFALLLSACSDGIPAGGTNEYTAKRTAEAKEDILKSENIQKIIDRTDELANFSRPLKPQKDYKMKSKFVLIRKNAEGKYILEGYQESAGSSSYDLKGDSQKDILFESQFATSPETFKTLVQVKCKKGNKISDMKFSGSGAIDYAIYAIVCAVSIFDMDSQTMVSQKVLNADKVETYGKDRISDTAIIKPEGSELDYLVSPRKIVQEYLKEFS